IITETFVIYFCGNFLAEVTVCLQTKTVGRVGLLDRRRKNAAAQVHPPAQMAAGLGPMPGLGDRLAGNTGPAIPQSGPNLLISTQN
ncbi:hypothetical protein, partial [Paracoccus sp. 22332]|uniref:hypothetical protein n=1 Tax=Paracoccus sp. 22332 TaxID=3453913 RepID=UPI003F84A591